MRGGESSSDFERFFEELISILPKRSQGYLRVFFFFVKKFIEDPSQALSAYAIEKEVVGISKARPILEHLAAKGYLEVVERGPVVYYRLNREKTVVKKILEMLGHGSARAQKVTSTLRGASSP